MPTEKADTFEEGVESPEHLGPFEEDEAYLEEEHDLEDSSVAPSVADEFTMDTEAGEGEAITGGEETARTEGDTAEEMTTDAEAPSTADEA